MDELVPAPVEPDPVEPDPLDPEPLEPEPVEPEPLESEPLEVSSVVAPEELVPLEDVPLSVSSSVSTTWPVLRAPVSADPYAGCALTTQPANNPTDKAAPRNTREGALQWGHVSPTRLSRAHAEQDFSCMS